MMLNLAIALRHLVGLCTLVGFVLTMHLQSKLRSPEAEERMKKVKLPFLSRFSPIPPTKCMGLEELEYYRLYERVTKVSVVLGYAYIALYMITK